MPSYSAGALCDEGIIFILARIAANMMTSNTEPICLKNFFCASHSENKTNNNSIVRI
jgi:hypothetical protein